MMWCLHRDAASCGDNHAMIPVRRAQRALRQDFVIAVGRRGGGPRGLRRRRGPVREGAEY